MCHLQAHEMNTRKKQDNPLDRGTRAARCKWAHLDIEVCMHIHYYEKLKSMRQVIKYLKDYATPYNTFYLMDVGFVCAYV